MKGRYGEDGYSSPPKWYVCPACGEYIESDERVFWIQSANKHMCFTCMAEYMANTLPSENAEDVQECIEKIY